MAIRLLIVDYKISVKNRISDFLSDTDYIIYTASGISESLKVLQNNPCDVIISETLFEDGSAFDLKKNLDMSGSPARFIITAQRGDIKTVLEALSAGVYDILKKPFSDEELKIVIDRAGRDIISSEKIDVRKVKAGWIEVQIPSLENSMQRLDRFFRLMYEDYVAPDILEDIGICFREVVRNAIEWGHKFDVSKPVKISHMLHNDEFFIRIDDNGDGFDAGSFIRASQNPMKIQSERENNGIRPGGMGMIIINGLMDKVLQNEKGNSIVFSKKIRKSNMLTI